MLLRKIGSGVTAVLVTAVIAWSATVVSHKTGARATVGDEYAGRFQSYVDEIEARGGVVHFMGGVRRGRCSSAHRHPCGKALDVCQLRRGVVSARCHLPPRRELARIAARHGLFEGGQWCSSDYGHAQVGVSAPACGERMMAARRHHHRGRYRLARARREYQAVARWNAL